MNSAANPARASDNPAPGSEPVVAHTFQTIVFATDFSLYSENAGRYARLLAEQFSATLVVAHAFLLTQPAMEVEAATKINSQQRKNLRLLLARTVGMLAPESIRAIPALLDGNPAHEIARLARMYEPALVVMGTHGGGSVERVIIGSVAESILRTTDSPAFTVGPHVPPAVPSSVPFRRILCASDLSAASVKGLALSAQLARTSKCELEVLHVVPQNAVHYPDRLAELTEELYGPLDRLLAERSIELGRPRSFVAPGHSSEVILEHVWDHSVDLLVLGINRTSHLGLEMRSSGAFRIIVDAPCPVITVAS